MAMLLERRWHSVGGGARFDDGHDSMAGSLYLWCWNSIAEKFSYLQKLLTPAAYDEFARTVAALSGDGRVFVVNI